MKAESRCQSHKNRKAFKNARLHDPRHAVVTLRCMEMSVFAIIKASQSAEGKWRYERRRGSGVEE